MKLSKYFVFLLILSSLQSKAQDVLILSDGSSVHGVISSVSKSGISINTVDSSAHFQNWQLRDVILAPSKNGIPRYEKLYNFSYKINGFSRSGYHKSKAGIFWKATKQGAIIGGLVGALAVADGDEPSSLFTYSIAMASFTNLTVLLNYSSIKVSGVLLSENHAAIEIGTYEETNKGNPEAQRSAKKEYSAGVSWGGVYTINVSKRLGNGSAIELSIGELPLGYVRSYYSVYKSKYYSSRYLIQVTGDKGSHGLTAGAGLVLAPFKMERDNSAQDQFSHTFISASLTARYSYKFAYAGFIYHLGSSSAEYHTTNWDWSETRHSLNTLDGMRLELGVRMRF